MLSAAAAEVGKAEPKQQPAATAWAGAVEGLRAQAPQGSEVLRLRAVYQLREQSTQRSAGRADKAQMAKLGRAQAEQNGEEAGERDRATTEPTVIPAGGHFTAQAAAELADL